MIHSQIIAFRFKEMRNIEANITLSLKRAEIALNIFTCKHNESCTFMAMHERHEEDEPCEAKPFIVQLMHL